MKLLLLFICLIGQAIADDKATEQDQTLIEGYGGCHVLRAALRIFEVFNEKHNHVFKDSKTLLKTVSYATTHWGAKNSSLHFNGIIPLAKNVFESTKTTKSLLKLHKLIKDEFCIDWHTTSYEDLKKPLYSVIAAELVLQLITEHMPGVLDYEGQLNYWSKHANLHLKNVKQLAVSVSHLYASNGHENCFKCHPSASDTLLIFDSSGSINNRDFRKEIDAGIYILNHMKTHTGQQSQAATMLFASKVKEYHFESIDQNIKRLEGNKKHRYYKSGSTNTATALSHASKKVLTEAYGARISDKLVTKNVVIFTDGASNSFRKTKEEARKMKKLHPNTNILAIGIGRHIKDLELYAIASDREYVQKFTDFSQLTSLIGHVFDIVCETPSWIDLKTADKKALSHHVILHESEYKYSALKLSTNQSVRIQLKNGDNDMHVYWSYTYDKPSEDMHDGFHVSAPNAHENITIYNPAVLEGNKQKGHFMRNPPTMCPATHGHNQEYHVFISFYMGSSTTHTNKPGEFDIKITKEDLTPPSEDVPTEHNHGFCGVGLRICAELNDHSLLCFKREDGQLFDLKQLKTTS